MSSSFQSTSGESFRTPVNTFVQPVTATRKSSMADVAEILSVVNPVLTKYVVKKDDQRNERKLVEGQEFILQADDEELKNAMKTINIQDLIAESRIKEIIMIVLRFMNLINSL